MPSSCANQQWGCGFPKDMEEAMFVVLTGRLSAASTLGRTVSGTREALKLHEPAYACLSPLSGSTQSVSNPCLPGCHFAAPLPRPVPPPHYASHLTWIFKMVSWVVSPLSLSSSQFNPFFTESWCRRQALPHCPSFLMLFIGFPLVSLEKTERPGWSYKSLPALLTSFPSSALRPPVSLQHWLLYAPYVPS